MRYEGLLLAAGEGKRLITHPDTPKALVKVGGETLVDHNLRRLIDVGIEHVVVVVGHKAKMVTDHLEAGPWRDRIEFVTQDQPRGTGDAVAISREALKSGPFILCYCDNFTPYRLDPLVRVHETQKNTVTFAVFSAEDPTRHGIMQVDGDRIVRIVERPKEPMGNLAFAGMGIFESDIYDAVEKVKRSASGEYYLTDAVMDLVSAGRRVGFDVLDVMRVNINSPDEFARAEEYAKLHPPGKDH
jgi:glucose-1-phosphate thymidylyltransferase